MTNAASSKKTINVILFFVVLIAAVFLYFKTTKDDKKVEEDAQIILKSVTSVSKLVVLESQWSEIYTYKETEKVFFNLVPTEKKAIVLLKAKAQISYDLKKLKIKIDKENKQLIIQSLPKEEIIIEPDLEYYDIENSVLNKFKPSDFNKIQKNAKAFVLNEIEKSGLKNQAKQVFIEKLQSLISLTEGLGWTVKYEGTIENYIKDKI
jgi:hypothetical protein